MIRPLGSPLQPQSAHVVLRGSLAPRGAVIKRSAASAHLLRHRGPALVFEDIYDLANRVDDPDLDVTKDSVMVLRNGGPIGAPGFPEFGTMPIPAKLMREGVDDIVRISDSRISGTSYGTLVVHVAPESAVGGPIGLVQTGDPIVLDVDENRLDIDIDADDLARRQAAFTAACAGVRARIRRPLPRARAAGARRGRLRLPAQPRGSTARPRPAAAHERLGEPLDVVPRELRTGR